MINSFPFIALVYIIFFQASYALTVKENFNPNAYQSDHFKDGRFFNPSLKESKGFFDFIKWQFTSDKKRWPDIVNAQSVNYKNEEIKKNSLKATFINHSTFLLELDGIVILTDPIWSERASPVSFAGPKRIQSPGLTYNQIKKIDVVIISHNHYDHLDLPSLKEINDRFHPKFFVGLGDKKLLEGEGVENVYELDWNQDFNLSENTKITFLKCRHWSARGIFDRFKSLWGAYLIEHQNLKVYFAGDTGYAEHFKEAKDKFNPIDLAILPIGAYEPRWFMKNFHMNPQDALNAAVDLSARVNLGMHLETFQLTDEGFEEPRQELMKLLNSDLYKKMKFEILNHGQSFYYDKEIIEQ